MNMWILHVTSAVSTVNLYKLTCMLHAAGLYTSKDFNLLKFCAIAIFWRCAFRLNSEVFKPILVTWIELDTKLWSKCICINNTFHYINWYYCVLIYFLSLIFNAVNLSLIWYSSVRRWPRLASPTQVTHELNLSCLWVVIKLLTSYA